MCNSYLQCAFLVGVSIKTTVRFENMNSGIEFDVVVCRVAEYINSICSLKSRNVVKVSKVFGGDMEASNVLSEILGNNHIRNEILENLCHCTFQGKAEKRELIVVPISRIGEVPWHRKFPRG